MPHVSWKSIIVIISFIVVSGCSCSSGSDFFSKTFCDDYEDKPLESTTNET